MSTRLILASASPRRRELLALLGIPFDVAASNVAEDWTVGTEPFRYVVDLARRKALDVSSRQTSSGRRLVLGADTVVVVETELGPQPLNKPEGPEDAVRMLRSLSGDTHRVYTGLALVSTAPGAAGYELTEAVVGTTVAFRDLTDEVIRAYVATGEPFDKAGGYGIQGRASVFVERIDGDYFNVVGLPVQTIARMLETAGIDWWKGAAALE